MQPRLTLNLEFTTLTSLQDRLPYVLPCLPSGVFLYGYMLFVVTDLDVTYLSFVFCCCAKTPQQKQFKREEVYLAQNLRLQSNFFFKSWWQEREAASHIICTVKSRTHELMHASIQFIFSFTQPRSHAFRNDSCFPVDRQVLNFVANHNAHVT